MLISLLVSYGKATKVTSLSVSYFIITVELFTFLLGFIKDCCSDDKFTRVSVFVLRSRVVFSFNGVRNCRFLAVSFCHVSM